MAVHGSSMPGRQSGLLEKVNLMLRSRLVGTVSNLSSKFESEKMLPDFSPEEHPMAEISQSYPDGCSRI